jgi:Family of unknown function (DUF5335)
MATRKIEKEQWKVFFDRVTRTLVGQRAEVEVDSLDLGSQIEAEWLPVLGIVYDPKDDVVEIALEGVDHLVYRPREIYVDEDTIGLKSLMIVDSDGVRQIVKLRDPLMLPAPVS